MPVVAATSLAAMAVAVMAVMAAAVMAVMVAAVMVLMAAEASAAEALGRVQRFRGALPRLTPRPQARRRSHLAPHALPRASRSTITINGLAANGLAARCRGFTRSNAFPGGCFKFIGLYAAKS